MSPLKGRYVVAAILSALTVAGLGYFRGAQATLPASAESVALASFRWGCVHTAGSEWDCPDTSFRFMSARQEIAGGSVAVTGTDGRTATLQLPQGTDAVFLTRSAVRRFLVPYYTRTNRLPRARALTARLRTAAACVHTEPSEWECPTDTTAFMLVPLKTASVTMTVTTTAGRTHTLPLPWRTDAVFLTRPSVQTFLLDYYTRTDRVKARQLRQHIQRF